MELAIVVWIFCGIGAAFVAQSRGASGCLWFALGVLLGPFGLALAFASGSDRKCPYCRERVHPDATRCPKCQANLAPSPVANPTTLVSDHRSTANPALKKCPDCAEDVRSEARKCRFCGFVFPPPQPATGPEPTQQEAESTPASAAPLDELVAVDPEAVPAPQLDEEVVKACQASVSRPKSGFNYTALAVSVLIFLAVLWIGYSAFPQHGLKREDLDGEPVSDLREQSALYDTAAKRVTSDHPNFDSRNLSSQSDSIIQKKGGRFTVLVHYREQSADRRFLCSINEAGSATCGER